MEVAEVASGRMWHALEDNEVVGRADLLRRPDRRTFVAVDAWHADVGAVLLETVIRAVPGDLYSTVGEDDAVQLALVGTAARTLLTRFGAVRTGGTVELRRPAHRHPNPRRAT